MPSSPGYSLILCAMVTASCARGAPASPASPTSLPAERALAATLAAVGGREAVLAAHSLVLTGDGELFIIGQGPTLDDISLHYRISGLTREIDLAGRRWHQRQTLTPTWAAQSPEPVQDVTALDGEIGFDLADDGTATRTSEDVARNRRTELRHTVLGVLQLALTPGASVTNLRRDGGRQVVDVRAPDGQILALTIDPQTQLPARIASAGSEDTLGDVVVETELAGYQRSGGLLLPTELTAKLDHHVAAVLRVSNAVNAAIGDLAAPGPIAAGPAARDTVTVTSEELAPGVWLLAGSGHHSVAVEQADHLVVLEAPWDDARTLAVLAKARTLRPGKPVTQVVCTHHHFDHAGGVRAAVSEQLTVVAHEHNRPFLADLIARQRTIAPDALAGRPHALQLETVADERTLADPVRPIMLYAAPSPHADTMLIAYLPRERLLIEADLFTPAPADAPPLRHPNARYLLRVVEQHHLDVDRVVPLHQQVVPFAALVEAAR
jgi:glyoxylase-like metal-dependent hydrolase (beta-lactamase superfamily II)